MDVRSQALKSLLFKIDNHLVALSQLSEHQNLYVLLLEWFNADKPQLELEVLNLIKSLIRVRSIPLLNSNYEFACFHWVNYFDGVFRILPWVVNEFWMWAACDSFRLSETTPLHHSFCLSKKS